MKSHQSFTMIRQSFQWNTTIIVAINRPDERIRIVDRLETKASHHPPNLPAVPDVSSERTMSMRSFLDKDMAVHRG
jgi:hypothetical protein